MKFLLDTHTLLWYLLGDRNLGIKAKDIIDRRENLYFSILKKILGCVRYQNDLL